MASIVLVLAATIPSSAASARGSSLHASRKVHDTKSLAIGRRVEDDAGLWIRLLASLETAKRRRGRHDKPVNVRLGDNGTYNVNISDRKRARRLQAVQAEAPYYFSVNSPTPTLRPTASPSLVPTRMPASTRMPVATLPPTSTKVPGTPPAPTSAARQNSQVTEHPTELIISAAIEQVVRPPVNVVVISSSTETPAPVPPIQFAAVPVGFDVLLETDSQQELDELAAEARTILEDHLLQAFVEGFKDQAGVVTKSVELSVRAVPTSASGSERRRSLAKYKQKWNRFLQQLSRAITLESRGAVGFQVNRNAVDTENFLNQINTIINNSVQPESLNSLFQNSTSGLSDYRVSAVNNTESLPAETDELPAPESDSNTGPAALAEEADSKGNDNNGPTLVELIIAIVLIVLMAASIIAYAYVFWKKHKKRQMRRKQFGVSSKAPTPYKGPPPSRAGRGASVTPARSLRQMTPHGIPSSTAYGQSSDSDSSFKGLGSESENVGADMFAKELRLAANLDRNAWNDFQHRQEQFHDEYEGNHDYGQSYPNRYHGSRYPSENGVDRDLSGMESGIRPINTNGSGMDEELRSPPGAVGLTVMGDTVSIQSNSSFPYGDEADAAGYLPKKVYEGGAQRGIMQDPDGKAYMTSPGTAEQGASTGKWRMTDAAESKLSPGRSPPKHSFLYHGAATEPDAPDYPPLNMDEMMVRYGAEIASAGAVRGSPMSQSWSTNPRASSTDNNGTTLELRGSPQSSSWNSASRDLSSGELPRGSPGVDTTAAVNSQVYSAGPSEDESMLLTSDILKEVHDLTEFVKKYEEKKVEQHKRADFREGEGDISYDGSLLDTVNSLQKAVEGSPQRKKSTGIPPVESMRSSDDESDVETLESDRRLGITPFAVQRPAGYQNPAVQHSPIPGLYRASRSPQHVTPSEDQRQRALSGGISPHSGGSLSSLRRNGDSILDDSISDDVNVPSDEVTAPDQGHESPAFSSAPGSRDPRTLRPKIVPPRQRSKNKGFNNIVNMFEAKPKNCIYPPNESWQYNG